MVIRNEQQTDTPRSRDVYGAHLTPSTPAEDFRTILLNRVSWGAAFAGAAIALTTQLVLSLFGIGVGLTTVQPYGTMPTVESLSFGAVAWWIVAGVISAGLGGFAAGRLAGEPKESTAGWHGLIAWAASVLFVIIFVTSTVGTVMGGNFRVLADYSGNPVAISGNNGMMSLPVTSSVTGGEINGTSNVYDPYAPANGNTMPSNVTTGGYGPAGEEISTTTTVNPPAATALPETTVNAETAANILAGSALLCAIALVLGAVAAWFGGRAGAVVPTLTDRSLRHPVH